MGLEYKRSYITFDSKRRLVISKWKLVVLVELFSFVQEKRWSNQNVFQRWKKKNDVSLLVFGIRSIIPQTKQSIIIYFRLSLHFVIFSRCHCCAFICLHNASRNYKKQKYKLTLSTTALFMWTGGFVEWLTSFDLRRCTALTWIPGFGFIRFSLIITYVS